MNEFEGMRFKMYDMPRDFTQFLTKINKCIAMDVNKVGEATKRLRVKRIHQLSKKF